MRSTSPELGFVRALVGVGAWYEARLGVRPRGVVHVAVSPAESPWTVMPRSPPMLPRGKKLLVAPAGGRVKKNQPTASSVRLSATSKSQLVTCTGARAAVRVPVYYAEGDAVHAACMRKAAPAARLTACGCYRCMPVYACVCLCMSHLERREAREASARQHEISPCAADL